MKSSTDIGVHFQSEPIQKYLNLFREEIESGVRISWGRQASVDSDFQILIAGRPERELLRSSSSLKHLIIPWAGLPPVTRNDVLSIPGITVHNIHHNAGAAAELAFSLMLAAFKHVIPVDRELRKGNWSLRYGGPGRLLLENRTALIIGFGSIGRRIAEMCLGFHIRVMGIRKRNITMSKGSDFQCFPISKLNDLLSRCSIVFNCLPLTDETRGLIGSKELSAMQRDAVLVNIGRAEIIREEALFQALQTQSIGAAALDVWYRYPDSESRRTSTLPSKYPFHELDNVVMSPHRGGAFDTEDIEIRRYQHLGRLVNKLIKGKTETNKVDLTLGY